MTDDSDQTLTLVPWRTGRKVHRTIYAQIGAEPSDLDILTRMTVLAFALGAACAILTRQIADIWRHRRDRP